jgi:hypothetical protein
MINVYRSLIFLVALSLLTACATPSAREIPVKGLSCPVTLTTKLKEEPQIPEDAKLPAPINEEQNAGMRVYLQWALSVVEWGRESYAAGNARGDFLKENCSK